MIFLKFRLEAKGDGALLNIIKDCTQFNGDKGSLLGFLHLMGEIRNNKISYTKPVNPAIRKPIILESSLGIHAVIQATVDAVKKSKYNAKVSPLFGGGVLIAIGSGEVKISNLENYTTADILAMLQQLHQQPAPDTAIRCDICKIAVLSEESLVATRISIGEDWKLCARCRTNIINCQECGVNEPLSLIVKASVINDDTGKTVSKAICLKCHNEIYPNSCRHCGNYYQDKECPCRIPTDFRKYIYAHNADVLEYLPKDAYSKELFGIEIEVGTLNKNRRVFRELAEITQELVHNNAILVYDSSIDFLNKAEGIDNNFKGFEIVTRPMIYKNAIRFVKEFCKSRHPLLKSWEVGTCGLHIHVSKAALRPIEQGKILKFVNNSYNRQFVKMIAKREDKKFAKFLTKKILDYRNNTPMGGGVTKEHYEAINTSKKFTLEFRIFRGTLNPNTIVSYLQFVKSLCEFVKVTPQDDLRYTTYLTYLFGTEKSQFRELKERLRTERLQEIKETDEI